MRAFFASIRFRLVLWFSFILIVILLAFSAFIYASQLHELRLEAVTRLENELEGLESINRQVGNISPEALQKLFSENDQNVLAENEVLIFLGADGHNVRIWGPTELNDISNIVFNEPEHNHGVINGGVSQNDKNVPYAFRIVPIEGTDAAAGYFLIGTPLDPRGQLQRLTLTLLIGCLITLTVALLGGFWLADRAMRPVRDITQTVQRISGSDLSLRLNLKQEDEIGQLAKTFNGMLSRLDAAFTRQRQFTADASHELRTPLTIINLELGYALSSKLKQAEYEKTLKVIQSENDFMTHLVNDLLLLARMDSDQSVLREEALDLSELTLEVIERLSGLAAKHQVRLEAGEFPDVLISGDRQHLTRMLSNLIENAIKYTAKNGGDSERKVQIETGFASNGTQAWVRVSDSGPGISKENLPYIFDRFYRVDKSRVRESDGSPSPSGVGLGLAIAQWIAQQHGGEITVESTLGHGTTFIVTLPAERK